MSTTAPQQSSWEPTLAEMAIAATINRICELPLEDRNDFYELTRLLADVETQEDVESIRKAMLEILDQRDGRIEPLAPDSDQSGAENQNWREFSGQRVKEAREAAGLTQAELADRSGIPQSHISRIENAVHSPSRKTLERIAEALGIELKILDPSA